MRVGPSSVQACPGRDVRCSNQLQVRKLQLQSRSEAIRTRCNYQLLLYAFSSERWSSLKEKGGEDTGTNLVLSSLVLNILRANLNYQEAQ